MSWIALRRATDTDPWQFMSLTDDQPARPHAPGEYVLIPTDDPSKFVAINISASAAAINQMLVAAQEIRSAFGEPPLTDVEANMMAPVAIGYILDPRRVPLTNIASPQINEATDVHAELYLPGHWVTGTASGPITVNYFWMRDGAQINGTLNTQDYEYTAADNGHNLQVRERAQDARGAIATADSNVIVPTTGV